LVPDVDEDDLELTAEERDRLIGLPKKMNLKFAKDVSRLRVARWYMYFLTKNSNFGTV
jgi:hypothetical protein